MRVLALDIGEKRVGVAFADTAINVAMPLKVMPAPEVEGVTRTFRRLIEDYEPELLRSGLPLSLSGERGRQATRVETVARHVAETVGLPLEFVDERLSSTQAKRIMHEQGMTEREMRGKLDSVAASIFLQSWLDRQSILASEDESSEDE